jgi:hypothetical protein
MIAAGGPLLPSFAPQLLASLLEHGERDEEGVRNVSRYRADLFEYLFKHELLRVFCRWSQSVSASSP